MRTAESQISDKEFEKFLPKCNMTRIGNKKEAIDALRELGYSSIDAFEQMVSDEGSLGMGRIGNTYYWIEE